MLYQDGDQILLERHTSDHPLEIRAPTMVVRAIEAGIGHLVDQPVEKRLVFGVHTQCYLRLATVSAKVSLPHQDADEKADVALRFAVHPRSMPSGVFHRRVFRETLMPLLRFCCFTVRFFVEP